MPMTTETALTVGTVARQAGVTVRTLHHYDEIGLVSPSDRTHSGYRLYGRDDIARLQEVLFFRELGFSLEEIKSVMARPGYRRRDALVDQRGLLEAKTERLLAMIDAVNAAKPDVLWVGMTAPKQEKWIQANRDRLEVPVIGAIGAALPLIHVPSFACGPRTSSSTSGTVSPRAARSSGKASGGQRVTPSCRCRP